MSLLDRVQTDFATILLNTSDFGTAVSYTPAGGAAVTLSCVVIPEDSRVESRDGFRVRVDRIHVSALNAVFVPTLGAKIVHDGRTWDFQFVEHDRGGGFAGAYFESLSLEMAGAVAVSPI